MRLFAITGSIGSGKSSVAQILEDLGAIIIDADVLARELVVPNSPTLKAIVARFGSEVLTTSGSLDRKALGDLVFRDASLRLALEEIMHPPIQALFQLKLQVLSSNPTTQQALVFYIVPLYFESRYSFPHFEKVIVVSAPESEMLSRICARDVCAPAHAQLRMATQLPQPEKILRADLVIPNDGTLEQLRHEVTKLYRALLVAS